MVDETKTNDPNSIGFKIVQFMKHYYLQGILFALFSVVSVWLLFKYHWLFSGQDLQFHLQRIDEMYNNLLHGHLNPYLATFDLNQMGSAVMSMYPKGPLYLFAGIRLLVKDPITSFYIGNMVATFLCLVVSYAGYHSVRPKDQVGAYVFAVAYSLSGLNITYNFLMVDIGISFTIIFLPLIFAGYYHWINSGKYRMLALGMTMVCLSHVLNILIVLFALVILLLIDIKKTNRVKWINLSKAVGITVLLSSSFWIPALHFGTSVQMTKPFTFDLNGINLLEYTMGALTNNIAYGFTLVALVGFVMAIVKYRSLSRFSKEIFWVGIGFVILSSSLFPWSIFQHTSLVLLQFPWRFLILPQLGFTYLFSVIGSELLAKVTQKQMRIGGLALFSLVVLGLSLNSQAGRVNFTLKAPELKTKLYPNSNQIQFVQGIAWYRVTNQAQYKNLMGYIDTADYLPQMKHTKFQQLSMQQAIVNNTPSLAIPVAKMPFSNGTNMTFEASAPFKSVNLPFVIYDKHYTVMMDGHPYPVKTDKDHVLTLKNVSMGRHFVKVTYSNPLMTVLISILTLGGIVAVLLPGFIKPKKNE